MHVCSATQSCPTLQRHGLDPTRFLCPWNFPGKNTEVGLPFPPPGNLPNLGIEPASPALQEDSLPLSHEESLQYLLQWMVIPYKRTSDSGNTTVSAMEYAIQGTCSKPLESSLFAEINQVYLQKSIKYLQKSIKYLQKYFYLYKTIWIYEQANTSLRY